MSRHHFLRHRLFQLHYYRFFKLPDIDSDFAKVAISTANVDAANQYFIKDKCVFEARNPRCRKPLVRGFDTYSSVFLIANPQNKTANADRIVLTICNVFHCCSSAKTLSAENVPEAIDVFIGKK